MPLGCQEYPGWKRGEGVPSIAAFCSRERIVGSGQVAARVIFLSKERLGVRVFPLHPHPVPSAKPWHALPRCQIPNRAASLPLSQQRLALALSFPAVTSWKRPLLGRGESCRSWSNPPGSGATTFWENWIRPLAHLLPPLVGRPFAVFW